MGVIQNDFRIGNIKIETCHHYTIWLQLIPEASDGKCPKQKKNESYDISGLTQEKG